MEREKALVAFPLNINITSLYASVDVLDFRKYILYHIVFHCHQIFHDVRINRSFLKLPLKLNINVGQTTTFGLLISAQV